MRFEFTVTLSGEGEDIDEAWLNAVIALSLDPGDVPDEYTIDEDEF